MVFAATAVAGGVSEWLAFDFSWAFSCVLSGRTVCVVCGSRSQVRINKVMVSRKVTILTVHRSWIVSVRSVRIPRAHSTKADPPMIIRTFTNTSRMGPSTGTPTGLVSQVQTWNASCRPAVEMGGTSAAAMAAPAAAGGGGAGGVVAGVWVVPGGAGGAGAVPRGAGLGLARGTRGGVGGTQQANATCALLSTYAVSVAGGGLFSSTCICPLLFALMLD